IENCRSWPSLTRGGAAGDGGTDAVLIRDGRIIALGAAARRESGPGCRHVDAGGAWLLPGLIESHMHIFSGGATLSAVDCSAVSDLAGLRQVLHDRAAADPGTAMITGFSAR